MITLYIETNFFIDFAKNQDQETENLVYSQNPEVTTRLKIITPAICCMEALSVLESERNRSNRFGDNLKDEVRKLKGYTQEELAESSKINLRTIQRIENGKNEPRGKTLNLICDVLEIDINEFKKTKTASNNRNIIDIIINFILKTDYMIY